VDAVVKGVRKTTSRWGGRLEPFNVCDLVLYRGRSLATVTQAQLVDVFPRLRCDREALSAAAVACEAVAGLTPMHEPDERIFALLHNALREFDQGFEGPAIQSPLLLGVLMKLLYAAGYMPMLDCCVSCGEGERVLGFSAAEGGFVCGDCLEGAVPATSESARVMRDAMEQPLSGLRHAASAPDVQEALRHLHDLYRHHTRTRLRALRFADTVGT
jgi:DNA repair protein RecO (recombination protein O)